MIKAIQYALDWLDNAPINYENGVTYMGIDEGEVLGRKGHMEITNALRDAIGDVDRLVEVAQKIENQASVIYSAGGFPGVAIPGELFEELRQALGDCYE